MKNIALIYTYSAKNAGDLAITLGALDFLSKSKKKKIAISRYSANDNQFHESSVYLKNRYPDLNILPSPFELNRDSTKIELLKQYSNGFLKILGLKNNSEFKKLVQGFDKVYFNGGNLLRCGSVADFIRLIALIYPLKAAIKANIPVIILPQSTATINFWGRKILNPVLNAAQTIYCREELTFKTLKNYFPKAPLQLNTDMAFYIKHDTSDTKSESRKIAITTRSQTIGDIKELSYTKKLHIENQLKRIAEILLNKGYHISFVVQTKKDFDFTQKIYLHFNNNSNKVSFFENYDPLELINFYSSCDLLIGMRLHSIILALTAGTPCIGYFERGWGLKNQGIIEAFDQYFAFVDENEEKLFSLIEKRLQHNSVSDEQTIKSKIQEYKEKLILE